MTGNELIGRLNNIQIQYSNDGITAHVIDDNGNEIKSIKLDTEKGELILSSKENETKSILDHIKTLNAYELSKILSYSFDCSCGCPVREICPCPEDCSDIIKLWLESEYKETK